MAQGNRKNPAVYHLCRVGHQSPERQRRVSATARQRPNPSLTLWALILAAETVMAPRSGIRT